MASTMNPGKEKKKKVNLKLIVFINIIALSLFIIFLISSVIADETLHNGVSCSNQSDVIDYLSIQSGNWKAQNFTPDFTGNLSKIRVYVKKNITVDTGNATYYIASDNSSFPGSNISALVTVNVTSTSPIWENITFPTVVNVTNGTTYWIVANSTELFGHSWAFTGNDCLPGLAGLRLGPDAWEVLTAGQERDLLFRIYREFNLTVENILENNHIFNSADNLNFTYNVSNNSSEIKNATVYIDGSLQSTSSSIIEGNNSLLYNATSDGNHTWFVRVYDVYGDYKDTNTSNFSIQTTNATRCLTLKSANTIYTLLNNISASYSTNNAGCFVINNSNITLDGQGYTLNLTNTQSLYTTFAVYVNNISSNTTIKNLRVQEATGNGHISPLYTLTRQNVTLTNITSNSDIGIFNDDSLPMYIYNSSIYSNDESYYAIMVQGHTYSTTHGYVIQNSTLSSNNSIGLYLCDGRDVGLNYLNITGSTIISEDYGFCVVDDAITINIVDTNLTSEGVFYEDGDYEGLIVNYVNSTITNFTFYPGTNVTSYRKWYLDVGVNDTSGSPIDLALVKIYNVTGSLIFDGLTNANGRIAQQIVLELTDKYNTTTEVKTFSTPHNITISATGYVTNSSLVNLTALENYLHSVSLVDSITTSTIDFVNPTPSNASYLVGNSVYANYTTTDTNYMSSFIDFNRSLVLWLRMNNESGDTATIIKDKSTYGNNGTTNAQYTSSGYLGGAYSFDGVDDSINITDSSSLDIYQGQFTISMWIYPRSVTNNVLPRLTEKRSNYLAIMGNQSNSKFSKFGAEFLNETGTNTVEFWSNTNATLNTWQHVVFVYDGLNGTWYINGVADATSIITLGGDWTGQEVSTTGYDLYIAKRRTDSTRNFDGVIDDVLMFNRNLSAEEIISIYNSTSTYRNFTNLADGIYTLTANVQNSVGNTNSTQRTFQYDIVSPSVNLTLPVNNTITKTTSQNLTANLSDNHEIKNATVFVYNSTGSLINQTTTNYSAGIINTIVGTVVDFVEGIYTWFYNIFDWAGNSATSADNYSLTIDLTNPEILITAPTTNSNFSSASVQVNFSANDTNLASCWSTKDAAITNTSRSCVNGTISNFSDTYAEGLNTVTVYVNDSANNINSSSITFRVDTTSPPVTITYPVASAGYASTQLNLNFTASDSGVGLNVCWYSNDSGLTNSTPDSSCSNFTAVNGTSGENTWLVCANDTLGNEACDSVTFNINTNSPATTQNYPTNGLWLNSQLNIPFNFTSIDTDGIDTCELRGNWTGVWHLNQSKTGISSGVETSFDLLNITDGTYKWNVWCNDTLGSGAFTLTNFTFNVDSVNPLISYGTGMQVDGANLSQNSIFVNVTVTELNEDTIIFRLYNSTGIYNTTSSTSELRQINWTSLPQGTYTYNVTVNDSAGNSNYTASQTLHLDTTNPTVVLISPVNNTITNVSSQNLTVNITDANIKNITLNIYNSTNGLINQTSQNVSSSGVIGIVVDFVEGVFKWFYQAFDWAGNNAYSSQNNTITIDQTLPLITLVSPTNTTYSSTSITLDITPSETLSSSWYSLNGGTNTTFTDPTTITASAGSNTIRVYGNDTAGNVNSTAVTFSVSYSVAEMTVDLYSIPTTPELGANLTLQANVTTNNTIVNSCNFSLTGPSGNIYNNENGTKSGAIWNSTTHSIISAEGDYTYNVTCIDEFGTNVSASDSFNIDYNISYTPSNYSFAARTSSTESNNITVYIHDTSSQNVNYTILFAMQNQSNFTITNPGYIVLGSSDSSTSPSSFAITVKGNTGVPDGIYSGNITLNNTLNGEQSIIYFTYGINPPSGIPKIYSTTDSQCTSIFGSLCSQNINIQQGSSTSFDYKIINTGGYDLSGCSIEFTGDLQGQSWISGSISEPFEMTQAEGFKTLTINVNPTYAFSARTYQGYAYITCTSGDALGSNIDSSPDNRPLFKIIVTSSQGQPGPTTFVINPEVNETELRADICGNNVCELGESYYSCSLDCRPKLESISDCFMIPFGQQCILKRGTSLTWVFLFIAVVIMFSIFFEIKRTPSGGSTISFTPPQMLKRRRRQ